ncbi:DUF58 domain-containing protein [Melaminivora sp.]|uniref:DUF58 domain-containing protein n=1 Tax=Melaminivora sp. TaxID=1933032 RepID=UPI0028A9E703|nr:DUF58 domain-containing protein [Melaminivora sp.]
MRAAAGAARVWPHQRLAGRWRRWWSARLPRSDTLVLGQRNLYVLPTGSGWMLAATLLVLLVGSINFQLNLGYLLTFLLAGSALASIPLAHATLRGLSLHLVAPEPTFVGSAATLQVQLHSRRRRPRHAVALAVHGSGHWALADVPAEGSASVQLTFAPARRGLQDAPLLTAQTLYPLGILRVWTLWRPAAPLLAYPRPEDPVPPLPPGQPQAGGGASAAAPGTGDFEGVRAYRRGDPLRLIVWKKAARALASGSSELVSRDSHAEQRHSLWLDAAATGLADPEARLSRLASWVLQADRLGLDYGLRLPGQAIAPASGPAHRRRCLEALALA